MVTVFVLRGSPADDRHGQGSARQQAYGAAPAERGSLLASLKQQLPSKKNAAVGLTELSSGRARLGSSTALILGSRFA